MNKYFLTLSFLTLFSLHTFAQITTQWGPKIGVTESKVTLLTNPDKVANHNGLDILAGAFYRIAYKKFELQPEVYYQNVGGSFKATTAIFRNNYQYVSVPLLFGVKPVEGLTLQVGPEYSVALNSNTVYGPSNQNDWGISAGARLDLMDIASLFSLNFRYTYGMSNVTQQVSNGKVPLDYRNRIFQLAITYNFSDYYHWYKKHGKALKTPKK